MNMDDYLEMYIEESSEHIRLMSDEMLKFEKNPGDVEIVTEMFRSAHTLKGMAGSMGFTATQELTHTIENMMDDIRNGVSDVDQSVIDFMFKGIDRLEELLNEIRLNGKERSSINDLLEENIDRSGPSKKGSSEKPSVIHFELDQLEKVGVSQAIEEGLNVFVVTFALNEDCLLKYVRTNMFFTKMGELGEIIKMDKTEDHIEHDETYDGRVNLLFVTEAEAESIEGLVEKLSEIQTIKVIKYAAEDETSQQPEEQPNKTDDGDSVKSEETKPNETRKLQQQSIRVNLEKLNELMSYLEELIIEKGKLQTIAGRLNDAELNTTVEQINRSTSDIQNGLLSTRMVPVDNIFSRFPRMVRNTSRELGKKVNFVIEGEETELDRKIVDELGDPLIHLLRNSLDHGVEMPELRKQKGKNEEGKIHLRAYHKGNEAFIEIEDDGNGINIEKIREKIVREGVVSKEEADNLPDEEVLQHIFYSGVSTAEKVTNLSGRGVGLDVVRTKIQELGGNVKVYSTSGKGTIFQISIPLTLSILQALLVREGEHVFLVPTSNVIETVQISEDNLKKLMMEDVLYYRGKILRTNRYGELIFGEYEKELKPFSLVVQGSKDMYSLLVDEIIGQIEIVLKPLEGYVKKTVGVMGAAVLGDGSIAFVLDINYFQ